MLLRDRIYEAIRQAILTAEFQPGQELREQILAQRYHVSRSPIRDALLRLEQENLVTVLPRQGYQVRPISLTDVDEILGLRLLIEPAYVAEVALLDDETLQTLDRYRGFADSDFTETGFVENSELFHKAIANMSRNTRLTSLALHLTEQFERLVRVSLSSLTPDAIHQLSAEHDAIIDAIRAHDADRAAHCAFEHAKGSRARILSALRTVALLGEQRGNPDSAD